MKGIVAEGGHNQRPKARDSTIDSVPRLREVNIKERMVLNCYRPHNKNENSRCRHHDSHQIDLNVHHRLFDLIELDLLAPNTSLPLAQSLHSNPSFFRG